MMLSLMYMVESEKRAREERERQVEAQQVWVTRTLSSANVPGQSKDKAWRKPRGVGKLVAAMGGIGW
jgi:hypothetical protein